jgi:tetratricopeptide (TPR) repeat protein
MSVSGGARGVVRRARNGWIAACQVIVLSVVPGLVQADWVEASSDHFVIYSEQDAETVRRFSERLELFHASMAYVFPRQQAKPSPSNRVTIFVVSNAARVRKLGHIGGSSVVGFYRGIAGRPVAVVSTVRSGASRYDLTSEEVLYHEYAHHVMWGVINRTFPRWYVEGFAETFAGVTFQPDLVALGAPAHHRKAGLVYGPDVKIRQLLAIDGELSTAGQLDVFYGKAWTLFHYLMFDPARAGQLGKYEQLLAAGGGAMEAAEAAFGDLAQLQRDMDDYVERRRLQGFSIPKSELPIGPIALRKLSAGEAAIMPTRMQSSVGIDPETEALPLVTEARRIAASYPTDPAVLTALAEAEFDAGNDDAAIAAADRALALDSRQMNAYVQKGWAMERKVQSGKLPKEAWKDVRSHWARANRAENDHPIPLQGYYLGFLGQGLEPTPTAVKGLEWALALAPFDQSLRWTVAQQMIRDERLAEAARTLGPLAYTPHPSEGSDRARKLLTEIEAKLAAGGGGEAEAAGAE